MRNGRFNCFASFGLAPAGLTGSIASSSRSRLMHEGGGVVLMHDLDRAKDRNDFVLDTTALLLGIAERESFHIKRLSEICH